LSTEEKELQEIKKHGGFKAKKFNKRLFSQVFGVPTIEKLPSTTEFQEFNLHQK